MPFAITLRLDLASSDLIKNIWRVLAAEHIDTDRHQLGYPPHITLAIYPDDVSSDILRNVVDRMGEHPNDLTVTLGGIGIFPGPTSILWAAPVVTWDLLAVHARVAEALPGLPIHPHYRPNAWMPHVTLTGAIPNPASALRALLPQWRPIHARLVQADLVRFRPVEVLASQTLTL